MNGTHPMPLSAETILSVRVAVEQVAHAEVDDDPDVAHVHLRRQHRERALGTEGVPGRARRRRDRAPLARRVLHLGLVAHRPQRLHLLLAGARADVEARHRAGLVEEVPHRLEVRLVELGQAEHLRLVRQGEPAHALVEQAGHLLDRQVHVPDREQSLAEQPAAGLAAGGRRRSRCRSAAPRCAAPRRRWRRRGCRRSRCRSGRGSPPRSPCSSISRSRAFASQAAGSTSSNGWTTCVPEDLRATGGDRVAADGRPQLAVEEPGGDSVDGAVLRHPVPHRRRHPRRPEVGRFGDVGVAVDDADAVEEVGRRAWPSVVVMLGSFSESRARGEGRAAARR